MTLDFAETTAALGHGAVQFRGQHDLVIATGPDARSFLQGQITQDIEHLAEGSSVESLVLSPQGKLDGYVRVLCQAHDSFFVDTTAGYGEALLERLRRFRLRVKVELVYEVRDTIMVRGPGSLAIRASLDPYVPVFDYGFANLLGFDAYATELAGLDDLAIGDLEALELARIRAGEPVLGAELTEKTIPQETQLTERCVSFTKGCFTGQELVARLDARGGNVARHLRSLIVQPGERHRAAYVGEPIVVGDAEVGAITSVVYSPVDGCSFALGYVHRKVEPPAQGHVIAAGGEDRLEAQILSLPFPDA